MPQDSSCSFFSSLCSSLWKGCFSLDGSFMPSASRTTSFTVATGTISSWDFVSSGTSSRSRTLSFGMRTFLMPARVAAIEGAAAAVAVASGHAAEILAFTNIAKAGDHIVASDSLYGGTWNILLHTLDDLGIKTTFVPNNDIDAFVAASNERTKFWYVETIGNPLVDVANVPALVDAAASLNLPVIVDNTFATPYLYRPADDGAAVIIESLTKWIGGHGATIGGAVIDAGKFDWAAVPGKFPTLTEPDESYHGAVWTQAAPAAPFGTRVLAQRLRDRDQTEAVSVVLQHGDQRSPGL